jgi:hypothetical protein
MIKYEIKVELPYNEELKSVIKGAYFSNGNDGKICDSNKHYIKIPYSDEVNYAIFRGLNSCTVKILNSTLIDGSMRFMVTEDTDGLKLNPISIYCIKDANKYIFY